MYVKMVLQIIYIEIYKFITVLWMIYKYIWYVINVILCQNDFS